MRRLPGLVRLGLGALFLPPLCPLCRNGLCIPQQGLCTACSARLKPLTSPLCPRCGLPFAGVGEDHPCPRCLSDPPPFDSLRAWGHYDGALLQAVRSFKYGGNFALGRLFHGLLDGAYERYFAGRISVGAVVPVPSHSRTLHRRKFDLPALLSARLCRRRRLPWLPDGLVKTRETPRLAGLSAAERNRAVTDAYRAPKTLPSTVLLVDDVATTTATARACAAACLAGGATTVYVLTLARTPVSLR